MSTVKVMRTKKDEKENRATSRPWLIAQAVRSHTPTATTAPISRKVSRLSSWLRCTAARPGWLATAALTAPAVTIMVTAAASCTTAPAHISRTAPRTERGSGQAGRSRIRSAPRIRSAASVRLTRC
jgi:hypothetical protein